MMTGGKTVRSKRRTSGIPGSSSLPVSGDDDNNFK